MFALLIRAEFKTIMKNNKYNDVYAGCTKKKKKLLTED